MESSGTAGESTTFVHTPVMLTEITAIFEAVPAGVVIDATVGGGGHTQALLDAHAHLTVVGLDQDRDALSAAGSRLESYGARVTLRQARFDELASVVDELGCTPVVGVLFDLGVSSPQLDRADRGFSYRSPGPLDMRMDRSGALTAADVVNTYEPAALRRVLQDFGDERFADRIARAIVHARPLTTTVELAEVTRDAIPAPARRTGGHPAKRTFQAIRIEVNHELDILDDALGQAIDVLAPAGRIAALAYHSGEDRIVKAVLRRESTSAVVVPPGLPVDPDQFTDPPRLRLLKRGAWKPTDAEIAANPRAESARLRAAERTPSPGRPGEAAA